MASTAKINRCVVVGGGIAGLAAARILADGGFDTTVLEKEATLGGRMSTREFAGGVFDDGAQFFTVKDERFRPIVERWLKKGILQDWFHSQLIQGGSSNPDGFPRYCGTGGMLPLVEELAEGIDVRTDYEVTALRKEGKRLFVESASGNSIETDAILLTLPVPLALDLLARSGLSLTARDAASLAEVTYSPCITLLAVLEGEQSGLTEWGGLRIAGDYIDWIADNHLKGISGRTAVTIQAMPEFSHEHWLEEDRVIARLLLDNAKALLLSPVRSWEVRRWEVAKPLKVHPYSHVAVKSTPKILLAGDGFQGYRVEGAAISGMEAAESILRQFA